VLPLRQCCNMFPQTLLLFVMPAACCGCRLLCVLRWCQQIQGESGSERVLHKNSSSSSRSNNSWLMRACMTDTAWLAEALSPAAVCLCCYLVCCCLQVVTSQQETVRARRQHTWLEHSSAGRIRSPSNRLVLYCRTHLTVLLCCAALCFCFCCRHRWQEHLRKQVPCEWQANLNPLACLVS
jgi:hypothetical protein